MFKVFRDLLDKLNELSKEITAFSTERGNLERRHQDELARLERAHEREVNIYREQLAEVKTLNERLLRMSGVDSLQKMELADKPVITEQPKYGEPEQPSTVSPLANIINRDKQREKERQQRLANAQSFAQEIIAEVMSDPRIKNGNNNGHSESTEITDEIINI